MRKCNVCNKHFFRLHKHHLDYKKNIVIEVCPKCHQKIHQKKLSKEQLNQFYPINNRADYVATNGNQEKKLPYLVLDVNGTILRKLVKPISPELDKKTWLEFKELVASNDLHTEFNEALKIYINNRKRGLIKNV